MTPVTIHIAATRSGIPTEYPGWIVPDTDELLAIDERYPASPSIHGIDGQLLDGGCEGYWVITHLPTGHGLDHPHLATTTRERAAAVAQAFYREATARGWALHSKDPTDVVASHNAMNREARNAFWKIILSAQELGAQTT